jgi:hypothetical protein
MNNSESPSPKDDLCQLWLQLAWRFWRSRKCKSLTDWRQTDRQMKRQMTDNGWSEKLTWAFSSGELKMKKKKYFHDYSRLNTVILQSKITHAHQRFGDLNVTNPASHAVSCTKWKASLGNESLICIWIHATQLHTLNTRCVVKHKCPHPRPIPKVAIIINTQIKIKLSTFMVPIKKPCHKEHAYEIWKPYHFLFNRYGQCSVFKK